MKHLAIRSRYLQVMIDYIDHYSPVFEAIIARFS